jgi:hypothetical protein
MVNFRRPVFPGEMSFFAAIVVFSFLFWNLAPFRCLSLKTLFSFSERRIGFLIHFVGVLSWFAPKVSVLVISFVFLEPFFEIVVEACGYRD